MGLPDNFLPFKEHINVIRKFIFPDFLTNTTKLLEWYCINILNYSPYLWVLRDICVGNELVKIKKGTYLSSKGEFYEVLTHRHVKGEIDEYLNFEDIFKLLSTVSGPEILKIFEAIIFPIDIYAKKLISLQAGNENIFPLPINNILEYASSEFCMKYHDKLFRQKLVKYLNPQEITIISQDKKAQCKIPLNIFSMHCDFHNLITEGVCDYNVSIIIVPIEFSEKAGQFFVKCLLNGNILQYDDLTLSDYQGFKNMVTYLGIMMEQ